VWGFDVAIVASDGRLQSQKVECYSKHNRPHPVPPQEAVDASWEDVFERNDLNKRLRNVLLCVDGRASPLKHAL
jgi:hypothetical protein